MHPTAETATLSLRAGLDHLAATERLSVTRPGIALVHELAAVANRLDGHSASFFPHPDGHTGSVVSGLVSSRAWMAEALGVPQAGLIQHVQRAAANPLPLARDRRWPGAGDRAWPRHRPAAAATDPDPQRA